MSDVRPASPSVSVVIPVFNEAPTLAALYERVSGVLETTGLPWELVLVDDGSRDQSWEVMAGLRQSDPRVSLVRLSRNFGHQIALTAGLDYALGDVIVVMDADLQDPPELVHDMLAKWREGFDVVFGVRTQRDGETVFKRASAAAFYRIIRRLTNVNIPADSGDFRLMSRPVVEAFKQVKERNRFIRGLVSWLGFRQVGIPYRRAERHAGTTKYPLHKMLRFAVDAIVSFSIVPLRIATGFGLLTALACFAYAGYAIYLKVITDVSIPGWASLMVAVVFLGGLQLMCMGILGEYLGRIYDEAKGRPLYLIWEIQQDHMTKGAVRHGTHADRTPAPRT